MTLGKKKVFSFVSLLILLIALPVSLYLLLNPKTPTKTIAFAPNLRPAKVATSNIHGAGFTISYVTPGETVGKILYGTSADNLDRIAEETDISTLHHIMVEGLSEASQYHFLICSGSECNVDNLEGTYGVSVGEPLTDENLIENGFPVSITTGPNLDVSQRAPTQAFGAITPTTDEPIIKSVLVRIRTSGSDSSSYSNLINLDGSDPKWVSELANLRTADLLSWYNLTLDTNLSIEFFTFGGHTTQTSNPITNLRPMDEILINTPIFCSSPTLLVDASCTISNTVELNSTWNQITGATSYEIAYAEETTFADPSTHLVSTTTHKYDYPGNASTIYGRVIVSQSNGTCSAPSAPSTVVSVDIPICTGSSTSTPDPVATPTPSPTTLPSSTPAATPMGSGTCECKKGQVIEDSCSSTTATCTKQNVCECITSEFNLE